MIEKNLNVPLRTKVPTIFFTNSMSDIFHERLSDEDILRIFDVMNRASKHAFQCLTKRSDRLRKLAPRITWTPNIWMGVSVESPKYSHRIDDLRTTKAAVKFLSMEPLLAPFERLDLANIDWVITGGESGQHLSDADEREERALVARDGRLWVPRADRVDWVRSIRDMCEAQGTHFFFKQWGGMRPKSAGRLLDGVEHDAMPSTVRRLPVLNNSLQS